MIAGAPSALAGAGGLRPLASACLEIAFDKCFDGGGLHDAQQGENQKGKELHYGRKKGLEAKARLVGFSAFGFWKL